MRNINKQAQKELYAKVEQQAHSLRGSPCEYQALTGLCPVNVIEMHAQKILALLDELEAKDTCISEQAGTIANQEKWIRGIEEAMITSTDRAKDAEKRIAELEVVKELFLRAKALMYQSGGTPIENSLNPIDAWLYDADRAAAGKGE